MTEPNTFHNMPDNMLIESILALEEASKNADIELKRAKNELLERKKSEIKIALAQKAEPYGSVSAVVGAYKISYTTPKKVEWEQEGLAELYKQIAADPDEDPREYIKTEYKVSEDAYKNWPTNLKASFEPHRTVKTGSVSIKIEPVKE